VQKQPVGLLLDWTNMGKKQLNWLLPRIPQTKDISLVGLEYNMAVSALKTCNCPMLQVSTRHSSNISKFISRN
jgi:hypothetical protein